jgi:hypothetical protein
VSEKKRFFLTEGYGVGGRLFASKFWAMASSGGMKTSSMSSPSAFQLIGRALHLDFLRLQLMALVNFVSGGATTVASGKFDGAKVDARLATGSSAYAIDRIE